MNPLLDRISIDPNVCFGKPCIKGTRIWVSLILDFLANGMTVDELRAEYPQLATDDIEPPSPTAPKWRANATSIFRWQYRHEIQAR